MFHIGVAFVPITHPGSCRKISTPGLPKKQLVHVTFHKD